MQFCDQIGPQWNIFLYGLTMAFHYFIEQWKLKRYIYSYKIMFEHILQKNTYNYQKIKNNIVFKPLCQKFQILEIFFHHIYLSNTRYLFNPGSPFTNTWNVIRGVNVSKKAMLIICKSECKWLYPAVIMETQEVSNSDWRSGRHRWNFISVFTIDWHEKIHWRYVFNKH